jgi:hypothetical protein
MSQKHFNLGTVFGRVMVDSVERKSSQNSEFINFQVNVSGQRCGSVRAFCRIWKAERFEPLLAHLENNPMEPFFLNGFYGQYWDEKNTIYPSYTVYHWEPRASDPRAAFILKGDVDIISKSRGGQRLLLNLEREGQEKERLELWMQDEKFLDVPENGQLIEVKGYLRQEQPEDDFGGSSGPVRSYVEELKIL